MYWRTRADVGLFGAKGIMTVAEELAVLIEQFFALRGGLRTGGFPRGWDIGGGDEVGMFGMMVLCELTIDL